MVSSPILPDPLTLFNQFTGASGTVTGTGFNTNNVPSGVGFGGGQFANDRPAVTSRNLMRFLLPNGPIVELYINPQNVRYNQSKLISTIRTKSGFSCQYWGENLIELTINGTTGTSGIEGINVLDSAYRNEQIQFDSVAISALAQQAQAANPTFAGVATNLLSTAFTALSDPASATVPVQPTLASMAFTVELYWSGEVYRGFFKSFNVTESAQNLGMFDYEMAFTATQKRGQRQNFLAWHRSPSNGPSNSSPQFGTPYSFGFLVDEQLSPPVPTVTTLATTPVGGIF